MTVTKGLAPPKICSLAGGHWLVKCWIAVHWGRLFASRLEKLSSGYSVLGSLLLLTGNDCLFRVRYEMAVRQSLSRNRASLHLCLAASCKWHVFSPSPHTSDQTVLRQKSKLNWFPVAHTEVQSVPWSCWLHYC